MGTMQMQKTRMAATTTKTAVTQKQSLDAVKTLLHGGLSSLSYLRAFFPEKVFESQDYPNGDRVLPFEDYVAGNAAKTNHRQGSVPRTTLQVLRRGRSKRADLLLDWLEDGAFAALEDGTLHAVQVYVHTQPQHRDMVVETYTFTIKYHTNTDGLASPVGLQLDNAQKSDISVETTNTSLHTLLRHIMNLCETLPDLPTERFISMALFYLPDAGLIAKPHGFISNKTDRLLFPEASDWETRTDAPEALHSAFHSAALRVTHLQHLDGEEVIPANLTYSKVRSQKGEIARFPSDNDPTVAPQPKAQTPSTVMGSEDVKRTRVLPMLGLSKQAATPAPTSDAVEARTLHGKSEHESRSGFSPEASQVKHVPQVQQLEDGSDTQTTNVPLTKQALQGMMQPEHLTQGDTQTQAPLRPVRQSNIPRSSLEDLRLSSASAGAAKATPKTTSTRLVLLTDVQQRLGKNKPALRRSALVRARMTEAKAEGKELVVCQCDHEQEEGQMIMCKICDTWQHLHCYGFAGQHDPRVPEEEHCCYHCLLDGEDGSTLSTLRELALRRRGMWYTLHTGMKRKPDLARAMSVPQKTADAIYSHLKKQHYVAMAFKSHKPGYANTGKPLWVPSDSGPNFENMMRSLFQPLVHINQFYANLPVIPASLGEQLLAFRDTNMPAAATPRSATLHKRNESSVSLDLDLRPSVTPFKTPSRPPPRNRHTLDDGMTASLPSKRQAALDDDEVTETPPTKRRTVGSSVLRPLKSVKTDCMVLADGFSSSPSGY